MTNLEVSLDNGRLTGFTLNLIAERALPFTVTLWNTAVIRLVADRSVNQLSGEISMPVVAERFSLVAPDRTGSDVYGFLTTRSPVETGLSPRPA